MSRSLLGALAVIACAANAFAQATETPQSRNTRFEVSQGGYVQFDWRGYPDWPVTPGSGRLVHETLQVRRARVGVDGRVGRLVYDVTVDPALAQMASSGRDVGAMVLGDLGSVDYQVGVFAGDGRGRGSRAKLTSAGRVV